MLIDKFPSFRNAKHSSLNIKCRCKCGTVVKLTEVSDVSPHSIGDVLGYDYECPYCLEETRVPDNKANKITDFLIFNGISTKSILRLEDLCFAKFTFDEIEIYEILCLQKETGLSISKDTKVMIERDFDDLYKAFRDGQLSDTFDKSSFETWKQERTSIHIGRKIGSTGQQYKILKVAILSDCLNDSKKVVLRGNDNKCVVIIVDRKGNVINERIEPVAYFDKFYSRGFTP